MLVHQGAPVTCTIEQWAGRRRAYLEHKKESYESIQAFVVWWKERVRFDDAPALTDAEWNHYFLDYLLHFHL